MNKIWHIKYLVLIIAFLLAPVINLFYALVAKKDKAAKFSLILFFAYYGLSFVAFSTGIDSDTYSSRFKMYVDKDFNYLVETAIKPFVRGEGGKVDITEDIIYFSVSRFTNSEAVLFGVFCLIFSIFYLKIVFLLRDHNYLKNRSVWLFLFCMVLIINPSLGVNQFRFWTASILLIYSVLNIYFYGRKVKYIIYILLTGLIHFGVWVVVGIYFLSQLLKNRMHFLHYLALASLFISFVDFSSLIGVAEYFGQAFTNRYLSYTGIYGDVLKNDFYNRSWYAAQWRDLFIYCSLLTLMIFFITKRTLRNKSTWPLLSFILLLLVFINLFNELSMIFRYKNVYIYCFCLWMICFLRSSENIPMRALNLFFMFPSLLLLSIQAKFFLDTTNINLLFSNPIIEIMDSKKESVTQFFDIE